MKKNWAYVLLFFLIAATPLSAAEESTTIGADYIIGPGDVLDISVWRDETLTKSVVVLPDGKISFPLIGSFTAAGKTLLEIKKEIEGMIIQYVPDPVLSIEVRQVNSMLIYVIGRVNQPGKFVLNSNVSVLQGLSIAGGLNPFAKRDKIKIFRQDSGKNNIINFKYDDVVENGNLEQNILLKRGDVIVVP